MNDDISNVEPPRKKRRVGNVYHEDLKVKEMNQFRVAEFRLEKKIFVSRELEGKIVNPLRNTKQAFGKDIDFWRILNLKNIFLAGPLQSQTWPVILHGDDVICISDDESDRRQGFLLPALFYIRNPPTPLPDGPTVLCVTVTSESALMIENEIHKFKKLGIECGNFEKYQNSQSKDQIKIIATSLEQLQKNDDGIICSISYLVLEQVDNMSTTQIKWINDYICKLPEHPQIIITSKKWTDGVQQLAKCCFNPIKVKVDGSINLTAAINITQQFEIIQKREDKIEKALEYLKLLNEKTEDKVVVFCNTADTAFDIRTELAEKEIPYDISLVEMNDENSEETGFKNNQILITNFAATDLNLDGITHLINLEFPTRIEKYIEQINRIRGIKRHIKLISLLSENDWSIVPDLVAVLREMKQVRPPALYELANQFKTITHSDKSHFSEIEKLDYFIDKSLMIETIIGKNDTYLITAPRKFGKSTNLSMVDNFFNFENATTNKAVFEKLKIGKRLDVMKKHFGQYVVLKVDMSKFHEVVTSVETCNAALRQIICRTYKEYKKFFHHLPPEHTFHKWCDMNSCKQLSPDEIGIALNELAMFLHDHLQKRVILICDEFDAICNAALSNPVAANSDEVQSLYEERLSKLSESTNNKTTSESIDAKAASELVSRQALAEEIMTNRLDAIIRNYFNVFADLVKTDSILKGAPPNTDIQKKLVETDAIITGAPPKTDMLVETDAIITEAPPKTDIQKKLESIVYKSIFSGVTAITCSGPSPLNSLSPFRFLENAEFAPFYGITIQEFDSLLERHVFEKLREEKDEALQFYNGYRTINGCKILCTHSVCKYLCNVHADRESRLKSYWIGSGSLDRYTKVWNRDSMRERLEHLVANADFTVHKFEKISAKDLAQITVICDDYEYDVNSMDILFIYLLQLGYFTVKDKTGQLLGVPNGELHEEFSDILVKCIQLRYEVSLDILNTCSKYFTQLVDDDKVEESLKMIGQVLSILCKRRPRDENGTLRINEATVEHLLFAMLLVSKFHIQSQIKVERDGVTKRSALKILDLCFYKWNFGVVMEVKCGNGQKETPKAALQQIKDKGYGNVLKNCQIPMKIIKSLFIGVQVTKEGEAFLEYTKDIEKFSC